MIGPGQSGLSCVIRVASSAKISEAAAVAELRRNLDDLPYEHMIALFSGSYDATLLNAELRKAFPGVPICGCTTAGQISPIGILETGIVLIAFPRSHFRIHSELISEVDKFEISRARDVGRRLMAKAALPLNDNGRHGGTFAIMLVDGLSNCEERLVAAVHWAIGEVALIGGSAGDSLSFRRASLIHDGQVVTHGAILLLVETTVPFEVLKTQNFDPTPVKLVVTEADTENRIVYELNAEPAAQEYAAAIGLLPHDLGPFSFASYPLVVKVGGDYYCRSIRNMNPDGSLTFFCAIDEGLVFTVARAQDMLKSTKGVLEEIDKRLGGIGMVLGFDCVLRRLDAENRQIRHAMDELYRSYNVVGFHTYGEQYNAMHLNQTLTGIAFGRAEALC